MATKAKPVKPIPNQNNPYEQFRQNLERENLRAAYWLDSMVYGIMAQVDEMNEPAALELACKIIAHAGRV